ncbi:right-handed parallel beta-helix repeat-containing protein [Wenzhouxiangella sediminis]|uniref:Right-handed parallel beta-helix repeat-containing protein n=1 Tax=Wenzhouxiangella sediminis TaxID=1792836 RepID=A0A3E1KD44_9GAMM|nr:right-handed parallel beta-helix repeat-containing protein [Wenzhouxiangella sediminis]RFF33037.1 hypothetical protein DZC52_00300 [Wenzhouxiangella sediminis]
MNRFHATRLLAGLLLICSVPLAAQSIHTVGPDANCDFASAQSAIDAADDGDTIRLMAGPAGSGFVVAGKALTLIGGRNNCSSGLGSGFTTFDQQGSGLVAEVLYNAAPEEPLKRVTLENLIIRGGGSFGYFSGGMLIRGTPNRLVVELNNVQVIENSRTDATDHGAGIRVLTTRDAAPSPRGIMLTIDDRSLIANNQTAGKGGGIYCESTHDTSDLPFLVFVGTGLISGNEAGSHGGGVAVNGCRGVALRNGGPVALFFPSGGIVNNTAGGRGGGLYVENGGSATILNRSEHAAVIAGNEAANGGGISVTDSGSLVTVNDAYVIGNRANFGGGLDVRDGARLFMTLAQPCRDPVIGDGQIQYLPCSVLADNEAIGGGALQVGGPSEVHLAGTILRGNQATSSDSNGGGSAVRATNSTIYADDPTEVRIEGALVHGNVGSSLFRASNAIDLQLRFTTVDDNQTPVLFQNAAATGQTTAVRVQSSILRGTTWRSDSGVGAISLSLDCVLGDALPAATGADSLIAYSGGIDPRFIDADRTNYRLRPDSPAIDYCDDRHEVPRRDLDYNPRGLTWDGPPLFPAPEGGLGPWDLGAYESPAAQVDLLFGDRFDQ